MVWIRSLDLSWRWRGLLVSNSASLDMDHEKFLPLPLSI